MSAPTGKLQPFLAKIERLTQTDIKYLLSGGLWLTVGQVGIAGIAFLSSIAFAHYVPKETFGTYRFLISLFWTLTAFGLTGIPTALVRSIAQGNDRTYWTALRFSLLGSIPLVVASLSLATYYAFQGNMLLVVGALIIACIGPGMQASYLYGALLEGRRAFKMNALSGLFLNGIPFIGLIALMLIDRAAPASAYLGIYLGFSVLTAASISYVVLRTFPLTGERVSSKEFRSYGFHLSAMNILFTLSQQVDKLMVFHALGAVELAVYTFATSIPDQLKGIFGNIETLSMPKFAQRPLREIFNTLGRRITVFSAIVTGIVVVYIIAAPFLFHYLFPAYTDAVRFSQIYALSLIPIGSIVPISLLQAHAAKRELYIYNTAIPLFQIATVAIGVYSFGIIGVIVSRILSRIASLILSLFLVHRLSLKHPTP